MVSPNFSILYSNNRLLTKFQLLFLKEIFNVSLYLEYGGHLLSYDRRIICKVPVFLFDFYDIKRTANK